MVIEDCIYNFNRTSNSTSNDTSNSTSNDTSNSSTSMIKNIYKGLSSIIGRDFTRTYKKEDVHKISYCIVIVTYHLYVKTFPEKLNINRHIFYELYPNFANYQKEEQRKLFNFYKCCVIFKNIIEFRRNFGFIFDSSVFILEGSNKKYTRGGGANKETRDRSKILFDVYGEVKKPSMRHKKSIFSYDIFSDISDEEEWNEEVSSYEGSSYEGSSDSSSSNEEYICLKKLKLDFSLFDSSTTPSY